MAKRLIIVFSIIITFIAVRPGISAEFDELDKPPEGAHAGQMLFGAFFAFGWPRGSLIDAEDDFLSGSYYTFSNDISKSMEVSHQSYALGLSFEYMPINHLGAVARLRRTLIVQNTNFGSDYQNWKGYLYRSYAFHIGPSIHATNRKIWDFVFTPFLGYAFGEYNATAVAKKILQDYETGTKYTGESIRTANGFSFGAELSCVIYFTGGLYVTLGGEMVRYMLDLGSDYNMTNPQTDRAYSGNSKAALDTYSIFISAGYAFSN